MIWGENPPFKETSKITPVKPHGILPSSKYSSHRPAYVAVPTAMAPYPEFSEAGSMMTLEVQDQTKNSLWDDPYEGFPSLVFGLPGLMLKLLGGKFPQKSGPLQIYNPENLT